MGLPAELQHYDALVDVIVAALVREFEVEDQNERDAETANE